LAIRLHGKITASRSLRYLWFAAACDGDYGGGDIQARRTDQCRIIATEGVVQKAVKKLGPKAVANWMPHEATPKTKPNA
jgi:hypothetical protein